MVSIPKDWQAESRAADYLMQVKQSDLLRSHLVRKSDKFSKNLNLLGSGGGLGLNILFNDVQHVFRW